MECHHGEIEADCPDCWVEELEVIPELVPDNVYLD